MGVFNKASLALVPDGIKDGKLYSIKPTDGSGDFTFTRGSNLAATRVDENGLIEKGRENLLVQSNQFDTTWQKSNSSVTSGQSGYDGSNNAWLLETTAASGILAQTTSISEVYTFSFYAKKGTVDYAAFFAIESGGLHPRAWFNLSNGTIPNSNHIIDATISDIGGGWYRCSATFNKAVTIVRIYPTNTSNAFAVGAGENIYIQDAQLEQGLVATNYIETGATTAKAGVLENLPRIDYTGGTPSLLLEPSRTNLLPQSEYFGATEWVNAIQTRDITITQTLETNPEGRAICWKIQGTTSLIQLGYISSTTSGTTLTNSIYVKRVSGTGNVLLRDVNNISTSFSLSVADGWKRINVTATATSTNARFYLNLVDYTDEILVWGAQIEEGSYPTSYIPTYGTAATRGVDTLIGSTAFNGGNAFSIYLEMGPIEGSEGILLMQTFPLHFYFRWTSASTLNIWNQDNNSTLRNITSQNRNQNNKILMVYDGSGGNLVFLNGTKYTASNYTWPSVDYSLRIGSQIGIFASPAPNPKTFKSILVFPEALSDADCITLTTP